MITAKVYAVKVTKRVLKQLPVKFQAPTILNAERILGWFYGDVLGKEHRHTPHVLCQAVDGGYYLVSMEHFKMDGTTIDFMSIRISHILIL